MCSSIQLLSNNIFSIPVSMKSVMLCLLMWMQYKKEHSLSGNRKNKPWGNSTISGYNECRKGWTFFSGVFFLPHDILLAEKFILKSNISGVMINNANMTVFCIKLLHCPTTLFSYLCLQFQEQVVLLLIFLTQLELKTFNYGFSKFVSIVCFNELWLYYVSVWMHSYYFHDFILITQYLFCW